jgi:hypothetical protein
LVSKWQITEYIAYDRVRKVRVVRMLENTHNGKYEVQSVLCVWYRRKYFYPETYTGGLYEPG